MALSPLRWSVPLLVAVVAGLAGCWASRPTPADPEAADDPVWYEDVTAAVGLDFVHDPGPTGGYPAPQSMGSGCALFDCDGDGRLDLYLIHHGGPTGKKNQLYRQTADGRFVDISAGSGLDIAGFNHGVAIGDVNNDGRPDVLLTQYGGIRLLLNRGGGRFEDVTGGSGLNNPLWGTSAAFVDYDRDGWLDLVVVNYLEYDPTVRCQNSKGQPDFCGPTSFRPVCSKLFRNRGPGKAADGTAVPVWFEDVSVASGIGRVPGPGLGVACADFDGDGWPDIFVSNDGQPNRLWINRRDGTFVDEAVARGVGYTAMGKAYAGMGVAVGDLTGHGLLDLYVTHLHTETHTLWRQGPRGQFQDQTASAGLAASAWRGTGFGTLMTDSDLDGRLDIVVANGRVYRGGPATGTDLGFWETYADRNQLFRNEGGGKLRDISSANQAFCGVWNVARGLAAGDYDNDGAPDLLVCSIGAPARLFRNVAPNRGHWLKVHAVDPRLKREAYGAEVRVRVKNSARASAQPATSFMSSDDASAHLLEREERW
ncbi:MAG: VCBS repeat-containing protein [Gemmataceae bacterium]